MNRTATTFATVAAELAAAFQTRTRASGETFVGLRDDVPAWIRAPDSSRCIVWSAHEAAGYGTPDDWIYARCRVIADVISEHDDCDAAREALEVYRDASGADVYTGDLLAWVATAPGMALADEAAEGDNGTADGEPFSAAVIRWAQRGQLLAVDRLAEELLADVIDEARRRA